ncbi:uncharacterized protein LOC131173990 isoform X2 [Hevea brasiliensis]|uniref:uncharacterized protein LOC131173990 isoform X2 n=1 Tax=Hevea brasiliensis TaxID=3981 RepID=UPI0025FAD645|nr:uncharacterized protein LOC131173990 isoform X2 [Hevea brasiliensis]
MFFGLLCFLVKYSPFYHATSHRSFMGGNINVHLDTHSIYKRAVSFQANHGSGGIIKANDSGAGSDGGGCKIPHLLQRPLRPSVDPTQQVLPGRVLSSMKVTVQVRACHGENAQDA